MSNLGSCLSDPNRAMFAAGLKIQTTPVHTQDLEWGTDIHASPSSGTKHL